MTKYWAFARGGAWRNPKPTGGPYVCEQCRLDARSGNDSTLTLQAVTAIELAPTDVCDDCGARLLEESEAPNRAGKHGRKPMIRKKWIDGEVVLSVDTEDEVWKALATGEAVELTRELADQLGMMEDDTISEAEAKAARYDPSD